MKKSKLSPDAQAVLNAANGMSSWGADDVLNDARATLAQVERGELSSDSGYESGVMWTGHSTRATLPQAAPKLESGEVARLVADLQSRQCGPGDLDLAATLLEQLSDLAADAVAGMRYIEGSHGRLYGVGWDRVYSKANALNPQLFTPTKQEIFGEPNEKDD